MIRHGILETSRSKAAAGPAWPTSGLVERWDFNDSLTGLNGKTFSVVTGTISYDTGLINKCAVFNGSTYIRISDTDIANAMGARHAYSFSLWINNNLSTGAFKVILRGYSATTLVEPMISNWPDNNLKVSNGIHTPYVGYYLAVSDGNVLGGNTWKHIVGTYDGTTLRIYVNGSVQTNTTNTTYSINDEGIRLSDTGGQAYTGKIDLLYMYSKALSSTEVTQLYNGGNGI